MSRTALRFGLLACIVLAAAACGSDEEGSAPGAEEPAAETVEVPAELIGTYSADRTLIRDTVMRFLSRNEATKVSNLPREERADARRKLEERADEFVEDWDMHLEVRKDGTFEYKLENPGRDPRTRSGPIRIDGDKLSLEVKESRNEDGDVVDEHMDPRWLTHEARWRPGRIKLKALGRESFEIVLYKD